MAEIVYKKISELPNATLPLAGTEYIEVSATGASKKGLWSGLFGAGWWAKLAAAFTAFKAPDSDHADNADTLGAGLETPTDFHDATQLVGAVPLANIPEDLTSKYATADGGNADTVGGYGIGATADKISVAHSYLHGSYTDAQLYSSLSSLIPNIGDWIPLSGMIAGEVGDIRSGYILSYVERISSTTIRIYGMYLDYYHGDLAPNPVYITLTSSVTTLYYASMSF